MDEASIRSAIADVLAGIAPEADLASVRDDEDLREALDLDSMDFLNLLVGLHKKTGVAIPEADVGRVTRLGALVAYLQR